MVGEEVVEHANEIKGLPQGAGETEPLTEKENFEGRPHPNPLLVARNRAGAETPIGRGLSNINEQNLARLSYVVPAWATHPTQTLGARMAWQADRLADLSSSGSKGEHS